MQSLGDVDYVNTFVSGLVSLKKSVKIIKFALFKIGTVFSVSVCKKTSIFLNIFYNL